MRLGLSLNPVQERALTIAQGAVRFLAGKGVKLVAEAPFGEKLDLPQRAIEDMDIDLLVCIGGDGTILRALQKTHAPVLGINTSIVGFLTEISPEEKEEALGRVLSNDFTREERVKLSVQLDGKRLPDVTNEAVLHGSQVGRLRHFHVWVDGQLAADVNADGIIVATPTGSTGYNLSAGGPLADPRAEVSLITAIAPFKLTHRPIVIPIASKVKIELARPMTCLLVLDGQQEIPVKGGEVVTISRSEARAVFVRFKADFYARFNEKFAFKQGLKFHGVPEEKG